MGAEAKIAVRVECYPGYRGEATPRRIFFKDREIGVKAVLDRWLDPEHRYFKLCGDDSAIYIIRHDLASDAWELILYESSKLRGER
jgi:hypothetical protein